MDGNNLIMDLTREQGPNREQQVQPPRGAWVLFFHVDLDDPLNLPMLTLQDASLPGAQPAQRPVVSHDHVWTIELDAPTQPLPAILRLVRIAPMSFRYWIYRDPADEFAHCDWILDNIPNPNHSRGRRWVVL